ncbi:hypothetical protein [Streptomyces sp. SP17KL33]|uniref:hypothetical protein n=1 Tax=Streptomyces sp. SP17KL33 TaxID=3002534 RepID=UPI002E78107B|nr:hypothetical protein [Streptomyces sp. SP17KL33]MEE1831783.1 hypothetical protein [Streptomyces sp. SP17KL33]
MVDVALAAVDVTATVFVMNDGGHFHRRHLLAEARRHLALVLRSRRRDPGLDDQIVATAISTHCLDTSEPKTARGLLSDYRLYTARWALSDLPARRSPPTPAPDRHLLETLRGQEFTRGLDDYIANRALSDRSRQSTVPHPGRRTPAADQLFYTADFAEPGRWWIAGADGKPPRESSRYERARVASLAVQNAIRAARTPPAAAQDDAPVAAHTEDHHDQASDLPHAVDPPGRDAVLTLAQRAAAQAHQQAAMAKEYLEGCTTDPATWLRTPKNLERLGRLHLRGQCPPPRLRDPAEAGTVGRRGQVRRPAAAPCEPARAQQGSGP